MTDFELRERVRSAVYDHLARLFELPDAFLVEERVHARLRDLLVEVNPEAAAAAERLLEAWSREGLDAVRRDHIALFVGPARLLAPPYGSVYLDGQREILGPSTLDVVRLYGEAGLQKAESLKDAPDHVRVELDFLHVAIDRTLAAMAGGDGDGAEKLVALQATFLQHHLGRWARPFAEVLRTGATTDYHRAVADVLEAVIRQEYVEDVPAMVEEFRAHRAAANAPAGS